MAALPQLEALAVARILWVTRVVFYPVVFYTELLGCVLYGAFVCHRGKRAALCLCERLHPKSTRRNRSPHESLT